MICIRSCSTLRSDGGFDASVRKQISQGGKVAAGPWQLETVCWEAWQSCVSVQVSCERNANSQRLARGWSSLFSPEQRQDLG